MAQRMLAAFPPDEAQDVKHPGVGAWLCALVRHESTTYRLSDLIQHTIAATRSVWGTPPAFGMVTFVDAAKVQSLHPGYCFTCAGFQRVGATKSGLIVLQLLAHDMPLATPAHGIQLPLFGYEEREAPHGK